MYLLINGAFGIGKSTVARELRGLLPRALVYDPEPVGLLLQRWPGNAERDFQDFPLWRQLLVAGARAAGRLSGTVIIPMAFSSLAYLDEVRRGLAAAGPVRHYCLTAPLAVVQRRLAARGEPAHDRRFAWEHRRARQCCEVHGRPEFAVHVPTEFADAATVARRIEMHLTGETGDE